METKIINLFGGPGCGKSGTAAGVFSYLKKIGKDCELVTEYAKDLTWSKRHLDLACQVYVFAKQYRRVHTLLGQVEWIITDSPSLLSIAYTPDWYPPEFRSCVYKMWENKNNLNFFINRQKKYNPNGRNQSESEAREIDTVILKILEGFSVGYTKINGDTAVEEIIHAIL